MIKESYSPVIDKYLPKILQMRFMDCVIKKCGEGMYEAAPKSNPEEGNISFCVFDIGKTIFLTETVAQAEKRDRGCATE